MADDLAAQRAACLEKILTSENPRKIIVAGAGTGKTHTFKELLKKVAGNSLAITFLNALANDMAKEVGELAETRTFHSFCRKLLHKMESAGITADFHFFPKLQQVVGIDAVILGNAEAGERGYFAQAFQALVEDDGRVEFFLDRASFYNAVGFDDSVYRVLLRFREEAELIPGYDQIVVDEYQDFNPLEVEFIRHLESKSPTMIVGDDDQAIYEFKAASPAYIREKASAGEYERHDLPFCSRCTSVVVGACNQFIESAMAKGILAGRLNKEYRCYTPDKEADSQRYPSVIHATCSVHMKKAPYIAKYIAEVVHSLPSDEIDEAIKRKYPVALVMGPSYYLEQIHEQLAECLEYPIVFKPRDDDAITALDGYKILLKDDSSNLGWRILVHVDCVEGIAGMLQGSANLIDLLSDDYKATCVSRLDALRALKQGEASEEQKAAIEGCFQLDMDEIAVELGMDPEQADAEESNEVEEERPEVWLTTYNGSKGMSAGFCFIVGLEDGVLPRNPAKPTDNEACQFIVALTRTRKECHLVSTKRFAGQAQKPSLFTKWLPEGAVKRLWVDKKYFER